MANCPRCHTDIRYDFQEDCYVLDSGKDAVETLVYSDGNPLPGIVYFCGCGQLIGTTLTAEGQEHSMLVQELQDVDWTAQENISYRGIHNQLKGLLPLFGHVQEAPELTAEQVVPWILANIAGAPARLAAYLKLPADTRMDRLFREARKRIFLLLGIYWDGSAYRLVDEHLIRELLIMLEQRGKLKMQEEDISDILDEEPQAEAPPAPAPKPKRRSRKRLSRRSSAKYRATCETMLKRKDGASIDEMTAATGLKGDQVRNVIEYLRKTQTVERIARNRFQLQG